VPARYAGFPDNWSVGDGMQDEEADGPAISEETERRREVQRRRLAEALRENLHKRKQQSRARTAPPE